MEEVTDKRKLSETDGKIKKGNKIKKILYIIIFILITQEIIFRIFFSVPEVLNFNRINYSPSYFDSTASELKSLSNTSFVWASDPDNKESKINLNIYGFRGEDFSIVPTKGKHRIAFVGNSIVEGYMANDDETIISTFNRLSNEKNKKYEFLNFGIGGADVSTYCDLLCDIVPLLKPDNVILIFNGKDFPPPTYNPEWFRKPFVPEFSHWWIPRLYYVLKNVFQRKSVTHRWINKEFSVFPPVPSPGNPWSNPEKASRYEKFISPGISDAIKKGRFNPYSVDEYAQYKEHLPEVIKITRHLNGIENFMAQNGKKIYIAYIPSRNQVSSYYLKYENEFSTDSLLTPLTDSVYNIHAKILKESCNSLGIPFIDCTQIICNEENSGNHLFWNYDEHLRPKGYAFIGKALFEWWSKAKNR